MPDNYPLQIPVKKSDFRNSLFVYLQGAFYGLLITHVIGVVRLILEIVYPVPICGEPDNRPALLSKVHGFYFAQMMLLVELIAIVVISLFTKQNTEEQVSSQPDI